MAKKYCIIVIDIKNDERKNTIMGERKRRMRFVTWCKKRP